MKIKNGIHVLPSRNCTKLESTIVSALNEKKLGLRYFMWVDVVKWLPNNPKSEEKRGLI
jgi:hypothetical protein